MNYNPAELPDDVLGFLAERQLATLSIPRGNKSPHVTPVAFTWEGGLVRVITFKDAKKVRLIEAATGSGAGNETGGDTGSEAGAELEAAVCQVDGARWLTLSGEVEVSADPERCKHAEELYAARFQPPKDRGADRRVIEIKVNRVMGRGSI